MFFQLSSFRHALEHLTRLNEITRHREHDSEPVLWLFFFLHTFPPPYYGKGCYNMVILHELEVFLNIFLLICRTFTFFKETERKKEGAVRYSRSRHSSIGIAADKSRCRKQESGEMMLISISISTEHAPQSLRIAYLSFEDPNALRKPTRFITTQ